jgi:hypothetical protein
MLGDELSGVVTCSGTRHSTEIKRDCSNRKLNNPGIDLFTDIIIRNNKRNRNTSCGQSSVGHLGVRAESFGFGGGQNRFMDLQKRKYWKRRGRRKGEVR